MYGTNNFANTGGMQSNGRHHLQTAYGLAEKMTDRGLAGPISEPAVGNNSAIH